MLTPVRSFIYAGTKSVQIFEMGTVDFEGKLEGYVMYEVNTLSQ